MQKKLCMYVFYVFWGASGTWLLVPLTATYSKLLKNE